MYLSRCMRSANRGGGGTWSLDPPPLGERECMDFLRKTIDSEVSDDVRQSRRQSDLELRSTPLGERECMDFLGKTIDSEVSHEVRQSRGRGIWS